MFQDGELTILRNRDKIFLAAAFLLGSAATLRSFGMDGIKLPSLVLLASAFIFLLPTLARLIRKEGISGQSEKPLLVIIVSFHIIATLFFFPPGDLANSRPVVTLDHAIHYYQVERGSQIFPRTGKLYCYDPYFMAGYPGGTIFDIDSKGVELWCALLQFIGTARAYKVFIFLGYLLLALTFYRSCRRFGYGIEESVYALLAILIFWHWGRPYAGAFRYAGMFAFLTVSHLSLYIASLFRSFLGGKSWWKFFIIGPLVFFLHPTAAVLLPIPFIATFLADLRTGLGRDRRWIGKMSLIFAGWCLLVLAANAIWLLPLLRYLDMKIPSETFFQIKGMGELSRLVIKPGNLPALFLLLLSAAGLIRLAQNSRLSAAAGPAAGSAFLFILTSRGTGMPLFDQMEPGRFLVPALIFAAPLSGPGIEMVIRALESIIRAVRLRGLLQTAAVALPLILMPLLGAISAREYYRYTLSTSHTPESTALIEALREHTGPRGRLMFEDGLPVEYGFCYLSSMIPLYTGVEQIGGPYPHLFMKHVFTNFTADRTMGSVLTDIDPGKMREYFQAYNIRWILTSSATTESYFREFSGLKTVWSSGKFTLRERSDYSRDIITTSRYNLIKVSFPPGIKVPEEILLEYHWDRSLKAQSPAGIEPRYRLNDPVPFILLKPGGSREVEIRAG
ncbi:MAG: hypothetical protein GF417_07600 [Candidatus Latescibacteria bacterium]|nr:hypothetical protein [bacterium]MBD3424284.1 hypothetical protein [Candidatus Latescibacterota bacterium]